MIRDVSEVTKEVKVIYEDVQWVVSQVLLRTSSLYNHSMQVFHYLWFIVQSSEELKLQFNLFVSSSPS